jgi:hypothetical protein
MISNKSNFWKNKMQRPFWMKSQLSLTTVKLMLTELIILVRNLMNSTTTSKDIFQKEKWHNLSKSCLWIQIKIVSKNKDRDLSLNLEKL